MESGRDTIHLQIGERKGKGAAGREVSFSEKIAGDFAVERERAGEEKERDGLTVWSAVVRPRPPPPPPPQAVGARVHGHGGARCLCGAWVFKIIFNKKPNIFIYL